MGILLFLGILWAVTIHIDRMQDAHRRACAFGLLLFYEVIHLVGFGLWQKWVCASLILSILGLQLMESKKS